MKKQRGVTPAILLEHMRHMEERIMNAMDTRFCKVDIRFSGLEQQNAQILYQIDNIDKRLDDIEVFQIPKLKKAVRFR